jgi:hypothetical protein
MDASARGTRRSHISVVVSVHGSDGCPGSFCANVVTQCDRRLNGRKGGLAAGGRVAGCVGGVWKICKSKVEGGEMMTEGGLNCGSGVWVGGSVVEHMEEWKMPHVLFCKAARYVLWGHTTCSVSPHGMFCEDTRYVLWGRTVCSVRQHEKFCEGARNVAWGRKVCSVRTHRMFCEDARYILWGRTVCSVRPYGMFC